MKTLKTVLTGVAVAPLFVIGTAAGLAVPALAIWALGHFAFGAW